VPDFGRSYPTQNTSGSLAQMAPLGPVLSQFAGTPALARSTASPVTGAWGTGQARTAGRLLVAVVTAGATTSAAATAQNTGTTGWAKQIEAGAASSALVAVWAKTAAGADAAPAFTSALSGTAAMTCALFEISGVSTSNPVDASGTAVPSGTVTFSVTTSALVAATGDAAISVFCQERAATTVTWSESGTGWSSAASDGATSSVAHTQINTMTGVGQGATLSDSGQFSTRSSAVGAAAVVVARAATPPPNDMVFPVLAGAPATRGREVPSIF
jgi:hypothetical protein